MSANLFGLHFPRYLFSFWEISWWNLSRCSSETAPMLSEKNQMWMQKMKFQPYVTPLALCDKISSCTISIYFSAFTLPRKFLQTFSNAFQALLSVKFNFSLKRWTSNSCVICGPANIPFLFLVSVILRKFALNRQNLRFYLSIAFTDTLTKPSLICKRANRWLLCLLRQNAPHSSDLVLFLNGVAIFSILVQSLPRLSHSHQKQ